MSIKAIQTTFAGYRFRSRLEARWAVFLNALGLPWEYEKEGYELASGLYLPDFWLPDWQCWLETKGVKPTKVELQLCEELAHMTGHPVALAWGLPVAAHPKYFKGVCHNLQVFCNDCTDGSGGEGWWEDSFLALDKNGEPCICSNNDWSSRDFHDPEWGSFEAMKVIRDISSPIPTHCINVARSARFEHGESGARR